VVSSAPTEQSIGKPRHIAIVMDGNGRWAMQQQLPRVSGHEAGAKAVNRIVEHCSKLGIEVLTLFAFSRENWGRPDSEVAALMRLFLHTLNTETEKLHQNNIQVRFIGDRRAFSVELQSEMRHTERTTKDNDGLTLVIAVNYSGRWDIANAALKFSKEILANEADIASVDEEGFAAYMAMADLPEPDLLIRTSGEIRLSNFLLWQIAYAELYFTDVLWPDFDPQELDKALIEFASRKRRFGLTNEQMRAEEIC
jgi:undecaprenyl diphosphate synthase